MRVCKEISDVKSSFEAAVREAKKAFNNGEVFIEKYIENPRHVEVQILADEQGNIVSSLCINLDVSDMLCMRNMLDAQLNIGKEENECFSNDISDVLESIINDTISHIGKPGFRMSRREKIEAIRYLDSHGAFLVKRSVERVCAALDVSRNSFYAYLDDARKNSDS